MVKTHLAVAGFHDWTRQPKRHKTNKHLEKWQKENTELQDPVSENKFLYLENESHTID